MPRLYAQRNLSDRVVTAIVRSLERALTISSSNRVDAVEETGTRSRGEAHLGGIMQREEWVQLQDLLLLNIHQEQGIWVLHHH